MNVTKEDFFVAEGDLYQQGDLILYPSAVGMELAGGGVWFLPHIFLADIDQAEVRTSSNEKATRMIERIVERGTINPSNWMTEKQFKETFGW